MRNTELIVMEIGTAEPIIEPEKERRRGSRLSGGSNSGNGNKNRGGGGGGGSDDNSGKHDVPETEYVVPDKSRILTGFLLLVVLMTFGGLIGAYIVISTNKAAEWQPFNLPVQVWISTFLILISSLAYHFAIKSIDSGTHQATRKWLIVTTMLGAAFISSQILAWIELVNRGLYVQGNPYAGFFYILTGVHAVHVLGGIIALGAVVLRTWHPAFFRTELEKNRILAQVVGWYWHFMGGIWVVLFILLGFWK